MLADFDSPIEVFEAEGHSGNGYAWDSVARVSCGALDEKQRAALEFNSEAGTFVVLCEQKDALEKLAQSLVGLLRDHEALRAAIRAVPDDDWDD